MGERMLRIDYEVIAYAFATQHRSTNQSKVNHKDVIVDFPVAAGLLVIVQNVEQRDFSLVNGLNGR